MPVLKNARHEKFAQELAKGKSQSAAYEAAGFAPHSGNAADLRAKAPVDARVRELLSLAADIAVLTKSWVLERLMTNAERALQQREVIDHHGVKTGEFVYDGQVANRALELLGKEQGMFIDRKEIDIKRSINEMSEDELLAILAEGNSSEPAGSKAKPNGSGGLH